MRDLIAIILVVCVSQAYAKDDVIESYDDNVPKNMSSTYMRAQEGDAIAQEKIARMYESGEGVVRNDDKAFHWYRLAARQGLASSQDVLGHYYANGISVPKDCGESTRWFKYAYYNGYKTSKRNLVWMLATCEDDNVRDGELALRLAIEDINENGSTIGRADNLAAALAETGEFEKAAKLQEELIRILQSSNQYERLAEYKKRHEYYLNRRPWRGVSYSPLE